MGADEIIDPAAESPYESWQDTAWPEGVDRNDPTLRLRQIGPKPGIVFECVGVPGVIDQIMHGSMRDTRVVVVCVWNRHLPTPNWNWKRNKYSVCVGVYPA